MRYYSLAQNEKVLPGEFSTTIFADVEAAAKNARILQPDVSLTPKQMIDLAFVNAAK